MAGRLANMGQEKYRAVAGGFVAGQGYLKGNWTGDAYLDEAALLEPLSWKKSSRIFVVSMGDLFYEAVPFEWIDRVFAVMALCPQHTFMVLTKRTSRMASYVNSSRAIMAAYNLAAKLFCPGGVPEPGDPKWPLPNV
jgi:protein gp37